MSNTPVLLKAAPLAVLALALAACGPSEEEPRMDQPAQIQTTPDNDPQTQPATGDPSQVDPVDPWDQQQPIPEDRPPTLDQTVPPTVDPTDEQVPPPDPEDAGDPIDP